jgi:hypothetical protein
MGAHYDYRRLINSFWYIAEALGKLGPGDLIPSTALGRLLVVGIILCGTIFISFGFVILINLLELSSHEKLALSLIETVSYSQKIRHSAAKIITYLLQINSSCRRQGAPAQTNWRLSHLVHRLKVEVLTFKRLQK